jgi:hypothetical protein
MKIPSAVIMASILGSVAAFAPPSGSHHVQTQNRQLLTTTQLYETNETKKNAKGIDRNVSNKLLAETIAPFRGLRLFFYAAFASGAFVGGLITLSGVTAALSGVRPDVDLNAEYLNLGIDFGAVALFGVLAKIDLDKGEELNAAVEAKVEMKKKQKKLTSAMREREQQLALISMFVLMKMVTHVLLRSERCNLWPSNTLFWWLVLDAQLGMHCVELNSTKLTLR